MNTHISMHACTHTLIKTHIDTNADCTHVYICLSAHTHERVCEWLRERQRLESQLCSSKACQVECRTSKLKADDNMTDELGPADLHIFTLQAHDAFIILQILRWCSANFIDIYLPIKGRLHLLFSSDILLCTQFCLCLVSVGRGSAEPWPVWLQATSSIVFRAWSIQFPKKSNWEK